MNDKQVNRTVGILYTVATGLVITGAFLMLQHHPYGLRILLAGFIAGSLINSFDTFRLKKKIKRLEEQLNAKG
ncbi:MAG: hypothetical protein K0B11_22190 [Mariniphaga sp.]|nr:hypothetical protein [Mariniphaga sp.]